LERARNLTIVAIPEEQSKALIALVERSMIIHINIQDGEMLVSADQGQVTVVPEVWKASAN
jgi:uncharacterized protein YaeQ